MWLQCAINWGSGFVNVPPPRNIEQAKFELSWTNSTPSASLQAISFEWVNTASCQNATNIWAYRNAGRNGSGPGIGEGLPLRVYIGGTNILIFDGVNDLPNPATEWERDMIKCPIKRTAGIDWFLDEAAAIPLRILYDNHIIGPPIGDPNYYPPAAGASYWPYQKTPYSITYRDWEQALMLFLEEFSMIQHTFQAICQTGKDIGDLAGTAANVPFPTVPEVIAEVLQLLVQLAYDIALIVALIAITEQLINSTVGVKKYKYCMKAVDIVNAGLYYMNNFLGSVTPNLQLSSTILQGTGYGGIFANTTFMPEKNVKLPTGGNGSLFGSFGALGVVARGGALIVGNEAIAGTVGPPYGYLNSNLREVFEKYLMPTFNAEVLVLGNKVYFEEKHFWDNQANFILPNQDKPGYPYNFPDPHGLNYSELSSVWLNQFMTDGGDEMTIKNYRGTTAECTFLPTIVNNAINLLPMPYTQLIFPCALGKIKTTLNFAEEVVNDLLNAVASVVNTLFVNPINAALYTINSLIHTSDPGAPSILLTPMQSNPLFSRFGWMEVSNDTWEEPKVFIGTPGAVNKYGVADWVMYPDIIPNAVAAPINKNWNMNPAMGPAQSRPPQYYSPDGQAENAMSAISLMNQFHGWNFITRGNQWQKYKNKQFRLLIEDFLIILNNNVLTTPNGYFGKFDKILWNPYNEIAESCDYRINVNYDNNFYESISVDGN